MIVVILIVLGLCLGSFVNALVWRLHEQSKPKKQRVAKDAELSIARGRSMCPNCQHTLSAKDLLPVISWLSLGGKCRYCRKPISWQYPVVEMFTAILFVVAYLYWPYYWQISSNPYTHISYAHIAVFAVFLASIITGMALAVYDFKWMLLPNKLVAILAGLGVMYAVPQVLSSTGELTLISVGLSVAISGGIFWALFQVSNGTWIGGGDVKLGLALGLFLSGPGSALLMLFASSLLGTAYVVVLMVLGRYKKNIHIPFGPFLLLGTFLVILLEPWFLYYYTKGVLL